MKIFILFFLFLIIQVDLRRHTDNDDNDNVPELDNVNKKNNDHKSHSNKEFLQDLTDDNRENPSSFQREKKYPSRKKILDDADNDDEQEKPRHTHSSKSTNRSVLPASVNRAISTTASTTQNYIEEASLCINEFDIKTEQLVKVKELKNGAHMIRFVRIDEPSSSHGLDVRDICMLNCCVEKNCDLAMLSEQRTNEGYKCYIFACNGSCTYAPHQDYTSMILKRDLSSDNEPSVNNKQTKNNEKSTDASSSTLSTTCRSSEFSCRDGSCIPYYDVCNSYDDCPSGIDEAICSPEFTQHQLTQKENRKKPLSEIENDNTAELDDALDDILDDETTATTTKSTTKNTSTKSSLAKGKSKNREGGKQNKNVTSSYLYNIDLDTQERVSKLQKLKEHLEETKGPEAWYHLFQTLIQHQQQDHSNIEPEQTGSSSSSVNDDENFKDHLLALEQQWIADRQKTTTTTTVPTTMKPKIPNRKITTTTTTTTTKKMKIMNDDNPRARRPPPVIDDELTDDEAADDDGGGEDGDRYYWQPSYDDRREKNRYNSQQKLKSSSTTRKSKTKYPLINRESTMTTLLRANGVDADTFSHTRSFLRESSVILLLLLGLTFTIILLVLVGFYCRDSWKRGRVFKNRSTDADYLINGLYL